MAPYLNKFVEQITVPSTRRINASLGFRSLAGAERTIQGYEAMHMIRKGQVRWLAKCGAPEKLSQFGGEDSAEFRRRILP